MAQTLEDNAGFEDTTAPENAVNTQPEPATFAAVQPTTPVVPPEQQITPSQEATPVDGSGTDANAGSPTGLSPELVETAKNVYGITDDQLKGHTVESLNNSMLAFDSQVMQPQNPQMGYPPQQPQQAQFQQQPPQQQPVMQSPPPMFDPYTGQPLQQPPQQPLPQGMPKLDPETMDDATFQTITAMQQQLAQQGQMMMQQQQESQQQQVQQYYSSMQPHVDKLADVRFDNKSTFGAANTENLLVTVENLRNARHQRGMPTGNDAELVSAAYRQFQQQMGPANIPSLQNQFIGLPNNQAHQGPPAQGDEAARNVVAGYGVPNEPDEVDDMRDFE